LINDNIKLLDDVLEILLEIAELENHLDNPSELSNEEIEEKKNQKQQKTQNCRRLILLSGSQLRLLEYLSKNHPDPFFDKRIRSRVARMVDFYLKKCSLEIKKYKIKDFGTVGFEPKDLLVSIVRIFLNLSSFNEEQFLKEISEEEAYYDKESFTKTATVIKKHFLHNDMMTQDELLTFRQRAQKIIKLRVEYQNIEERLGEIPDKYMCQLMCNLMKDPVKLPTNGLIVDRANIEVQILQTGICPYTRKPLASDMLEPVPDLKEEIEAWVRKRLQNKKSDEKKD